MDKSPRSESTRKPPVPSDGHADIDDWMRRVMPDLHPLVTRLDNLIRDTLPQPQQYAVKWKKAYYGVPDHGWVIEMFAYAGEQPGAVDLVGHAVAAPGSSPMRAANGSWRVAGGRRR